MLNNKLNINVKQNYLQMKKLISLTFAMLGMCSYILAQGQAETFINEALSNLKAKQYKQAQMSLQDAINEINNFIAKEVLNQLPTDLNDLKADVSQDNSGSGAMAMLGGGMTISRKYASADGKKSAEINIISNSPMISSLSMIMNNPMMMGNNPNQKSVRVGNRRAILNKSTSDTYDDNNNKKTIQNFELQVIIGQTLVTVKGENFENEQAFSATYGKIDIEKIAKSLGEN